MNSFTITITNCLIVQTMMFVLFILQTLGTTRKDVIVSSLKTKKGTTNWSQEMIGI